MSSVHRCAGNGGGLRDAVDFQGFSRGPETPARGAKERLMAMVRDDTGAEPDRQVEALQRAGMLRRN